VRSSLTGQFLEAAYGNETDEVLLSLMTFRHPDWVEDVRIVANREAVTHDGKIFEPLAFEISLPDEEAEGIPVLRWQADNVSGDILAELRKVTGRITGELVLVLASSPSVAEVPAMQMELYEIEYDALTISGTLTVEPILDDQFGWRSFNPANAPALF
jgi:hypothetical protein